MRYWDAGIATRWYETLHNITRWLSIYVFGPGNTKSGPSTWQWHWKCSYNLHTPTWQPFFGLLPLSVYQWQCVCGGVGGAYCSYGLISVLYATDFRTFTLWACRASVSGRMDVIYVRILLPYAKKFDPERMTYVQLSSVTSAWCFTDV